MRRHRVVMSPVKLVTIDPYSRVMRRITDIRSLRALVRDLIDFRAVSNRETTAETDSSKTTTKRVSKEATAIISRTVKADLIRTKDSRTLQERSLSHSLSLEVRR